MKFHTNQYGDKLNLFDIVEIKIEMRHPNPTDAPCLPPLEEQRLKFGRIKNFMRPFGKTGPMILQIEEVRFLGEPESVLVDANHVRLHVQYKLSDPPRGRQGGNEAKHYNGW
jgi:hypothetical protein